MLSVSNGPCGPTSVGVLTEHDPTATSYRLVSIDGQSPPATFVISQRVTIQSSHLCLFTDQTYRMVTESQTQFGPGPFKADPVTGPYSFSGTGMLGSALMASINATRDTVRLTYPRPAETWVYVADPQLSLTTCIRIVGYY